MRYPEGNRRSNSINISADGSIEGIGGAGSGSRHPLPLRFPSSSSTSQDSQNSLPEHEENENDLPGRTQAGTPTTSASGKRANIETISEHVLFGNNNGHNSFLYLYYSSSSSHHNHNSRSTSDNILKRPYTTTGGIKGGKIMGDDNIYQKQQPWNDLSGGRGSAGPSPIFYNNNEEDEEDDSFTFDDGSRGKRGKVKEEMGFTNTTINSNTNGTDEGNNKSGDKNVNEFTPYPVYLSPVEGSPTRMSSISPKDKSVGEDGEEEDDEDTRTSSGRITGGPRQDRLDSFGADLLDDDWDKIYSVPDVDSRYMLSPEPSKVGTKRKSSDQNEESEQVSSSSTYHHQGQLHRYNSIPSNKKQQPPRTFNKQQSTTSSNTLSVSKSSLHSSANSLSKANNKQGSTKKVRVIPDEGKWGGGSSMRKSDSTSSVRSGGRGKKLSPLSSTGPSRSPSTRSLKRGNSTRHGVTHHHHKPLSGNSNNNGNDGSGVKRASSTNTGDGFDQMSFQFQNGIGAFFGTPASRHISQKQEPTPEEMYNEEMQGWRPRLATGATIFTATLFILSCVSLLFVFPILVDPILVGFEADFSNEPVMCRTTNFRNGSGPSECLIPSCREGCTLDLFSCIFVDVEYFTIGNSMNENLLLEPISNNNSSSSSFLVNNSTYRNTTIAIPEELPETTNATLQSPRQKRSAILLININGCGYPPEVTCSDFEKKYAPLNTQFPCYYSQQNESIVVPAYSRRTEIIHLTLAVCVPFGVIFLSATSLYLLIRYHKHLKTTITAKYAARKKALRAKWREERENMLVKRDEEQAGNDDDDDVQEDDATSITELEPHEDYNYRKNIKAMQNGTSKTGTESRLISNNTVL